MTDTTDLVRRLRNAPTPPNDPNLPDEAADAIERLSAPAEPIAMFKSDDPSYNDGFAAGYKFARYLHPAAPAPDKIDPMPTLLPGKRPAPEPQEENLATKARIGALRCEGGPHSPTGFLLRQLADEFDRLAAPPAFDAEEALRLIDKMWVRATNADWPAADEARAALYSYLKGEKG